MTFQCIETAIIQPLRTTPPRGQEASAKTQATYTSILKFFIVPDVTQPSRTSPPGGQEALVTFQVKDARVLGRKPKSQEVICQLLSCLQF